MVRHVLLSNPSVQMWRQVESWLTEHLWGQSSRIGMSMESKNAGMSQFCIGRLRACICAPWNWFLGSSTSAAGFMSTRQLTFCTSCRPCQMFCWAAGLLAGAEPPGQRHLRWGWSHEGCGGLTVVVPSPAWTSEVADRGLTLQMHTLAWVAQALCKSVSGQLFGILKAPLCWDTHCVPLDVLCHLYSKRLCIGDFHKGLVMEGVAGGDHVPFLGHSQLMTFLHVKGYSHLFSQASSVLRSSCIWIEWIGVLMTKLRMVSSAKRHTFNWFHLQGCWYKLRRGMALGLSLGVRLRW